MKNKLMTFIVVFLLLVPMRLPISILFIRFFRWLLGHTTSEVLSNDVLATNVIVTKMVYNIALSAWFLYSIEMFSREKMGRKPRDGGAAFCYWWCVPLSLMLIAFIVMDAVNVNSIFFSTK